MALLRYYWTLPPKKNLINALSGQSLLAICTTFVLGTCLSTSRYLKSVGESRLPQDDRVTALAAMTLVTFGLIFPLFHFWKLRQHVYSEKVLYTINLKPHFCSEIRSIRGIFR